jgi:hypothetical protein
MAGTNESFSLELWSLATFRVATFTVSVVLSFHLGGSLSATLSRLDTATGFGFFLLLWATTWLATRTGLRQMRRGNSSSNQRLASAIVAGGWNGLYVFIALLVGFLFFTIRDQRGASVLPSIPIGFTIGGLLAFVVGGLVGLLYGLVDAMLLGFSAWLFRWTTSPTVNNRERSSP